MAILPFSSPPAKPGGSSSPLTTKGDLFGFSTTNARVPVGTNGRLLMGDSAQTLGVGYSTTTADFNGQLTTNAIQHRIINTVANPASPYTSFLSQQSSNNVTGSGNFLGSAMTEFGANSTWTLNESLFNIATIFKSNSTVSLAASINSGEAGAFHDFTNWTAAASTATYTQLFGLKLETQLNASAASVGWTLSEYDGVRIQPRSTSAPNLVTAGTGMATYGVRYVPGSWTFSGTWNEWSWGSDQGNAYFNGLTIFGGGSATATAAAPVNITGVGTGSPTNIQASILDSHSRTYASTSGAYNWLTNGTTTITGSQGFNYSGIIGLRGTLTFTSPGTAGLSLNLIDFQPTVNGNTAIANIGNFYGLYFQPTLNLSATGTLTAAGGIRVFPNFSAANTTITKYVGISSGMNTHTSTITTTVGIDIGVTDALQGSTIWNMQCANNNSYHQGPFAIGGTSTPVWAVDMQLANSAKAAYGINGSTTAATKAANLGGYIQLQRGTGGTNWYWAMSFTNGSGTQFWTSTRADSAANPATWVTATTAPV